MLKNKDFYTTEEDSIKLKDILDHKKADAFWVDGKLLEYRSDLEGIPAFRNDTLLAEFNSILI